MSEVAGSSSVDDPEAGAWHVARRLEAFRGEERANLVRVIGVALFYLVEVLNHHELATGSLRVSVIAGNDDRSHLLMTGIALAWMLVAASVLIALRNRLFPAWVKYATTGADVVLATAVLVIADGPQSPLVVLYFAILAIAALRFESWLVHFTTTATIVSYFSVVLLVERARPALAVPRYQSIVLLLALAAVGLVLAYVTTARPADVSSREAEAEPPRRAETDLGLWALTSLIVIALMIVIGIEVAILDTGLALAVTAACAPVLATLASMLWARRPGSDPARVQVGTTSLNRRLVLFVLALLALTTLTLVVALGAVAYSELYPTASV